MINNENIIKLQLVNGLGRKTINKIIEYMIVKNIKTDDFTEIIKFIKDIGIKKVKINIDEIERESKEIHECCKKLNLQMIGLYDERYPQKFKNIEDKPLVLYIDGNLDLLNQHNNIAIVGTRKPSQKGYETSSILAEKLAEEDCTIVSGFATGCDEAAHSGCLNVKGKTIAVIPSGHQCIYPKGNKVLYNRILLNDGMIISEIPPNKRAEKHTFIDRNRIIAAISEGIIVIEGGKTGGTSHTVKFANLYNKPVAYTNIDELSSQINLEQIHKHRGIHFINSFEDLIIFKNNSVKKLLTI